MDDVQDLAGRTGQEVADWRATLNNHTDTLNAMSDKIDHFRQALRAEMLDGFAKVNENFVKVNENFAKVDENFAKVEEKFALLHEGQNQITKLLNRHFGEPDEEPRAGGTGE